MSPKDLEKLVKVCRKYGIKRFKTAEVELELGLEFSSPKKTVEAPIEDSTAESRPQKTYTEEDALFWSSAGTPEV